MPLYLAVIIYSASEAAGKSLTRANVIQSMLGYEIGILGANNCYEAGLSNIFFSGD